MRKSKTEMEKVIKQRKLANLNVQSLKKSNKIDESIQGDK